MTIGTGTFIPQGQFASPRSYYEGIVFDISGYTVTDADYSYQWRKISDPNEFWTIAVDSRFWNWNSNRWTLDHIMTDFYYQYGMDPTRHPQPYTLQPCPQFVKLGNYLLFQFAGINFGQYHSFKFPAAPAGYWAR